MGDPFIGEARIIENTEVSEETFLMRLLAPKVARSANPGQFVMVRTGEPGEQGGPLLKRPLSIHRIGPGDEIALLYRVVGQGTLLLSHRDAGRSVELLGPLGRGFPVPDQPGPVYLAGGGIGVAPLLALAEALPRGSEATLFYGEKTAAYLVNRSVLDRCPAQTVVTTDDGSKGREGFLTEPLAEALGIKPAPVYICGPRPMMAAAAGLAANAGAEAWVSLEAHMACGMGACLGCVTRLAAPSGDDRRYARVCMEGPVFPAREVAW